ncbi:MAG: ribosome assembly RNA-binding protein YhbY [Clostridia bacterium]|nr:ribosome assembly RNA-binding protein YhbY [Clostridia bacterium]
MITSKQRAYLRGLANPLEPIFQIGKNGAGDEEQIKQIGNALEARELIKLHVLESCPQSVREAAGIVAEGCGADVVSVIGYKFVLYRPSETKRKENAPDRIVLPR